MAKTPMTIRGAELLRVELQRLKTVDRPSVITAIAAITLGRSAVFNRCNSWRSSSAPRVVIGVLAMA